MCLHINTLQAVTKTKKMEKRKGNPRERPWGRGHWTKQHQNLNRRVCTNQTGLVRSNFQTPESAAFQSVMPSGVTRNTTSPSGMLGESTNFTMRRSSLLRRT